MPYFDHNATSPLLPIAREAWLRANEEAWANPSSPYRISARVHRHLDEARSRLAGRLGASCEQIIFTSGATEANNAVIAWAARVLPRDAYAAVGATEHPSVLEPAKTAFGDRCRLVSDVVQAISDAEMRPGVVASMAANNETGVVGELAQVAERCERLGAWFLCDAVQWFGRRSSRELPATAFLVGSAHKFGGPKGVGFVRVPEAARTAGFCGQRGGQQEFGRRAGTENYPAIAAMVAAFEAAEARLASSDERATWRARFIDDVVARVPGTRVNSGAKACLWNTVSLRMPAHENTRWVVRLDKLGFEVSTGSACASGSAKPSHVLAAMGLTPEEARRTIRISSGWETCERDWHVLTEAIVNVWEQLQLENEAGSVIQL